MTGIFKNSAIFNRLTRVGNKISTKWKESQTGWLVTRNMNDIKTKNSAIYRFFDFLINKSFCINIGGKFGEKLKSSVILNLLSHYEAGVYLFVFLAPVIPTMLCVAIALFTLLSFFINSIVKNNFKIKIDAFVFFIIVMVLLFFIYSITSYTSASSMKIFMIYAVFIAFMLVLIACGTDKRRLKNIIFLFVLSGLFVSLYGIYQNFYGSNVGHAWIDEEMFSDITVRVYSTLENPNVLGEYLILLIPVCGAMVYGAKRLISKIFFFSVLCCAGLCLVFTQSRGCWVGLILAAVIFAFLIDKKLIAFGIITMMFLPMILPESIINRFTSIGNMSDSSTSYRVNIWYGSIGIIKDYWWMGIGLGQEAFSKVYPFYSYSAAAALHSHNLYLQILVETGIYGFVAFILSMAISVKKILVGYIVGKKNLYSLICAATIAGLFGFLLQGMFDYVWYNYRVFAMFWMVIGIGIASRRCACDEDNTCYK